MGLVFRTLFNLTIAAGLVLVGAVPLLLAFLVSQLPSVEALRSVRLEVPLRVYTADGKLIGEFGAERRTPVPLAAMPHTLIQAVLAAEDQHFFEHPGVDWHGIARAVSYLARTGEKGPGGSTITMQVARNFFLSREKTYARKLSEILLALRIEKELHKEEILELYLNTVFFGQRAYGVAAAAYTYYGRDLNALSVDEIAVLAGLPKAPSRINPVTDPDAARDRRDYVLRRMRETGHLDEAAYRLALAAPIVTTRHVVPVEVSAPHMAEMVRIHLEARLGEGAYTRGYQVYTTLDSRLQEPAQAALRTGLLEYDRRHGYRGPERNLARELATGRAEALLDGVPAINGLVPALVIQVEERSAAVHVAGHGEVSLPWSALEWARPRVDVNRRGPAPRSASEIIQPGDLIRLELTDGGWRLAQVPEVEGALVAMDPADGAIVALVGGFDFQRSQFNRVTQALRQPGSSFKPFIYSAALERGYTAASIVEDEPFSYFDPGSRTLWTPANYDGQYRGPMRLRDALAESRNLVSIRLLDSLGVDYARSHAGRFGLDVNRLPRTLSLALGSGEVTPLELNTAYCVFANGGYRVVPYFIRQVADGDGLVLYEADPLRVCPECAAGGEGTERPLSGAAGSELLRVAAGLPEDPVLPKPAPRVLDPRNAWVTTSMLADVIRRGTARRALVLKRDDLAGKTGTTNDYQDAWFAGFNPGLVATAWVGFDQVRSLGNKETGGRAALPIWISFMAAALAGSPDEKLRLPSQMVTVRIDPSTGAVAAPDQADAVFETFAEEFAPEPILEYQPATSPPEDRRRRVTEELF